MKFDLAGFHGQPNGARSFRREETHAAQRVENVRSLHLTRLGSFRGDHLLMSRELAFDDLTRERPSWRVYDEMVVRLRERNRLFAFGQLLQLVNGLARNQHAVVLVLRTFGFLPRETQTVAVGRDHADRVAVHEEQRATEVVAR